MSGTQLSAVEWWNKPRKHRTGRSANQSAAYMVDDIRADGDSVWHIADPSAHRRVLNYVVGRVNPIVEAEIGSVIVEIGPDGSFRTTPFH